VIFNPRVSIIIPVYNGGNYMRAAIDSALSQTYDNTEVVVVDDGSTDNNVTMTTALSYGNRIKFIHKPNGGVATALNRGIKEMTGEYFSWLSHDDVYEKSKVSSQVEFLSTCADPKTVIYSNYSIIDKDSVVTGVFEADKAHPKRKLNESLYPVLNGLIHGCTLLIHREILQRHNGFNERLRTTQDYDLWFRMLRNCMIRHLSVPLVQSRSHPDQDSKKNPNTIREANELWIKMVRECSDVDALTISESKSEFYRLIQSICATAGYTEAASFAGKMLFDHSARIFSTKENMVSVIIPFFNRVEYLLPCVMSALGQTHANIEVILVNDGSTDDLAAVNDLIETNAGRLRMISNFRGKGVSGARNSGILAATGSFIAFLDSDDLFEPEKIEVQIRFMLQNDYFASYTSYTSFRQDNPEDTQRHVAAMLYTQGEIIRGCTIATPTVMCRREIFDKFGYSFHEDIHIGEDICLWMDISGRFPFHPLIPSLTRVRLHNNASGSLRAQIRGIGNILSHACYSDCARYYPLEIMRLLDMYKHSLCGEVFGDGGAANRPPLLHPAPCIDQAPPVSEREMRLLFITRKISRFFLARFLFRNVVRPMWSLLRRVSSGSCN
jgi:glycosyltransferase involved in cell wall biosynthesis